jgi:glutamine amidotransferase
MVYKGEEVLLAEVVTQPPNSIIHQSRHSPYLPYIHGKAEDIKARNHAINGDGFGVAWYDHICPEEPCVFTSILPSWHCSNLQNLAHHIRTHCVFAHVRAASPGSVISQTNCHPFRFGRLVFMHNGGVAHFDQVKFSILQTIRRTSAQYLRGTTDSEHAGALLVHYLGDPNEHHSGHELKNAMLRMISHIVRLVRLQEAQLSPSYHASGSPEGHMPSSLNFAVSDGSVVIATRFRDSTNQDPPSLYYSEAQHALDQQGNASPLCWKYPSQKMINSIVIASEPLTKDESAWKLVPKNHLLVVTNSHRTIVEPMDITSFDDSAEVIQLDGGADELTAAGKWDEDQAASITIGVPVLSPNKAKEAQPKTEMVEKATSKDEIKAVSRDETNTSIDSTVAHNEDNPGDKARKEKKVKKVKKVKNNQRVDLAKLQSQVDFWNGLATASCAGFLMMLTLFVYTLQVGRA